MKAITKITINMVCVAVLIFGISIEALAQAKDNQKEKEKTKITTRQKEVQGEVVSISKDYISVLYNRDSKKGIEYEMLLPIDENTKLERIKNIKELNVGDTINIEYEEESIIPDKGEVKASRKAKLVSFVAPAPKGLVSMEE